MTPPRSPCPACGETTNHPEARFCENCGTALGDGLPIRSCRCAEPDPDDDGFCQGCGVRPSAAPKPIPPVAEPDYEAVVDSRLALASDRGRRHPTNQDFGAVARRGDGAALLVICDGVSTSDNAEGASRDAVGAAFACFLAGSAAMPPDEQARRCVDAAAAAVLAMMAAGSEIHGGPATTIVLAVVWGRNVGLAWVGDSRAYLVMPGVPEEPLTRDDSWCMDVVDAGRMTYETALLDVNAHAITQWLGMPLPDMTVHTKTVTIPPMTSLLLCSDGLWNYVDARGRLSLAHAEASSGADTRETCRRLVALANAAGGRDNITVAILTPS